VKETAMTRRIRLWITAVITIAATALMVGLTITAQAGVNHTHPNPPLAGIIFNSIDQAPGTGAAAIRGTRPRSPCRAPGAVALASTSPVNPGRTVIWHFLIARTVASHFQSGPPRSNG